LRRNREACLAPIFFRQALGQFPPRLAAVLGFVDTRCRAAIHEHRHITNSLPGNGIHDIGVARVHVDLGDARVLIVNLRVAEAVTQHFAPALPAVSRLEQAAVPAAGPKRPLRGNEDRVRIPGIDADHSDALRPL
jgi:hypothetical protein